MTLPTSAAAAGDARLVAIRIYPVKAEPGESLDQVVVEGDGLAGDRRKKAAVHLIGADQGETTRANLVIDVPSADLVGLTGRRLRVGEVVLGIAGPAGNCAGVYADVLTPGSVALGDRATAEPA